MPGQFGEGGDGTQVGGKYSHGLLDSVYKGYAGGVNQVVWHGYAYRDAPAGVGTSGRDGSWPGYHPWDIFGVLNVNDEFGPRQPSWPDYKNVNDDLARTQLVLRQGRERRRPRRLLRDLGLAGAASVTQQPASTCSAPTRPPRPPATPTTTSPRRSSTSPASSTADGGLFGEPHRPGGAGAEQPDHDAVAERPAPPRPGQAGPADLRRRRRPVARPPARQPNGDQLAGVVDELLAQPIVVRVADEAALPGALRAAGIRPTVTPGEADAALGLVRREAAGVTYDFVYNRSAAVVEREPHPGRVGPPVPAEHLDRHDRADRRVHHRRRAASRCRCGSRPTTR